MEEIRQARFQIEKIQRRKYLNDKPEVFIQALLGLYAHFKSVGSSEINLFLRMNVFLKITGFSRYFLLLWSMLI